MIEIIEVRNVYQEQMHGHQDGFMTDRVGKFLIADLIRRL
jgi:hypothetical protein